MAFSLPLILTSNLLTRSVVPFRPTVVSPSRFVSIIAGHRSYTSIPTHDFDDQSWVRNMFPNLSSMSLEMEICAKQRSLALYMPKPDSGWISMDMPGQEKKDNTWLIQGKARIELPYKTFSNINKEMKDGILEKNFQDKDELKTHIMSNIMANIIASFRDITTANRTWPYYDMFFDRSILGEGFCHVIAMMSPINSFTIFKEETAENLRIWIDIPGCEKVKLTTQGLCVSLKMRRIDEDDNLIGPEKEDIKTYFDYDTFFIEGKTKADHYITGIHLPEGIHKKNNMIKKEMKNGVFYAFLPCVKKEEIKINYIPS